MKLLISILLSLILGTQDELSITNRDVSAIEEQTEYNNFALVVSEALRD